MGHRRINCGLVGAAALVAIVAHSAQVDAGATFSTAYCGGTSTSGSCYGTFAGFRNSPDPTAVVNFSTDIAGGALTFYATFGGAQYTCVMPSSFTTMRDSAIAANGYFYVSWSLGTCGRLMFINSSSMYP